MLSRKLVLLLSIFLWSVTLPFTQKARAESVLNRAVVQNLRNIVRLIPQRRQARPARVSDAMTPGDALSTGRSSLAELRFNDGSLARIGEQAVFRFLPKTRRFNLSNGTVLLLIPPGRGVTGVQTPNAAAAIRGSALFVRYIPDTDTTIVGALTNSNIEVFNGAASESQVLEAGQMAVVVENRIESLYEFDLDTFYETSDLVQQLNLDQPSETPAAQAPDPAIASVRAETAAAAATQAPVTGQGVIENPAFVQPPTTAPPQTPLDQGSPAPATPAPASTPATNDSALPGTINDKNPVDNSKPAIPQIDDSTRLPGDENKPSINDSVNEPKLPLDDNTLPTKPLESDSKLPDDDKTQVIPSIDEPKLPVDDKTPVNQPTEDTKPEIEAPVTPPTEDTKPEIEAPVTPPAEDTKPEIEAPVTPPTEDTKPEIETPAVQPELPLGDTPAATDAVQDNQDQILENTINNPPKTEPEPTPTPDATQESGGEKTGENTTPQPEPAPTPPVEPTPTPTDEGQPVEQKVNDIDQDLTQPKEPEPSQTPATSVESTTDSIAQPQTPPVETAPTSY